MADDSPTRKAPLPSRAPIDGPLSGMYAPLALLAGMQLDLFTPLGEGPLAADALARRLKVDGARLERLLRTLVNLGLLTRENGTFANTPAADAYLVRGRPAYMGETHLLFADIWQALSKMADTVREGHPQHLHDFTAMTPGELENFLRGLHAGAMAAGADLNRRFDFSGVRRLVDVAGGSGGVSIALCRRHADMRATVLDLPRVTPHTMTFLAEAGLSERVAVETHDVVAAPLTGAYDAAVLRAFLQVLGPEEAAAAVRHVAAGLAPGGMMYIVGHVLDDDRLSPASTAFFDLVFMNVYTAGRAHTEGEHRQWLAAAGMTEVTLHTRPDNLRIVSARKP